MSRLKPVWDLIGHYKYAITIIIGVLIVGFLDENSVWRSMQLQLQISDLQAEIERYRAKNEAEQQQLQELQRDPRGYERIARERYFMKADDEDIFVLSDDPKPNDQENETTE